MNKTSIFSIKNVFYTHKDEPSGLKCERFVDLVNDPDLIAVIQTAVDDANKAVSKAESIRKFTILPVDFTIAGGHLTAKLSVKRHVVAKEFAAEIEKLYE